MLHVRFVCLVARPGEIKACQKSAATALLKFVFVKIIAVPVLRSEEEPVLSLRAGCIPDTGSLLISGLQLIAAYRPRFVFYCGSETCFAACNRRFNNWAFPWRNWVTLPLSYAREEVKGG
jgi:hypothetical protein